MILRINRTRMLAKRVSRAALQGCHRNPHIHSTFALPPSFQTQLVRNSSIAIVAGKPRTAVPFSPQAEKLFDTIAAGVLMPHALQDLSPMHPRGNHRNDADIPE